MIGLSENNDKMISGIILSPTEGYYVGSLIKVNKPTGGKANFYKL
jgi:hypothetical protein